MRRVMELALADAEAPRPATSTTSTRTATATEAGDIAESAASDAQLFGDAVPISTLKGHLGHTLGACGAIEAWLTIGMAREGWVAPNKNLDAVDPRCAPLDYVRDVPARAARPHRDEQQLRVRRA
jgi:3-oxoacyl-[acyl-carrier-protein] synthase II